MAGEPVRSSLDLSILDNFHSKYEEIDLLQEAITGMVDFSVRPLRVRAGEEDPSGKLVVTPIRVQPLRAPVLRNVTLRNCNACALIPCSFKKAFCDSESHKGYGYSVLFYKGLEILYDFLENEKKPESEILQKILVCLLSYLLDTGSQKVLSKEQDLSGCSEPILTTIIVNHFLLKLSPVDGCTIDKSTVQTFWEDSPHPKCPARKRDHFLVKSEPVRKVPKSAKRGLIKEPPAKESKAEEPSTARSAAEETSAKESHATEPPISEKLLLACCPCDVDGKCQTSKEIMIADTSIGNRSVWHGKMDCLFGGVAVQNYVKGSSSPGIRSSFELEKKFEGKDAPIQQIIAQAITFSFMRARQVPELNFVPTIAVSAEDIKIYFYDSKEDVLFVSLKSSFSTPGQERMQTILMVWLAINYEHLGCQLDDEVKSSVKSCNFANLAGDKLHIFKNELNFCVQYREREGPDDFDLVDLPPKFQRFKNFGKKQD